MMYFRTELRRCKPLRMLAVVGFLTAGQAAFAQQGPTGAADPSVATDLPQAATTSAPRPSLIRTFASTGLLAEFNSNENLAAFTTRLGTYNAHQSFAAATGITAGYRDSVSNLAIPLKLTLALTKNEDFYLKLGLSQSWTNAGQGNLTETDSHTLSGQVGVNYRPQTNLVFGLSVVAGSTNLDLRHNNGTSRADYVGLQLEYMQRLSNSVGLAARAILSKGTNETAIPIRGGDQIIRSSQSNRRIYLETSALADVPPRALPFLPAEIRLRPIATVMYQQTQFAESIDSSGRNRPATKEELGILRLAVRLEKEERRQWRLAPYVAVGLECEVLNSASRIDDDPANSYLKAGLGMNTGGRGRIDLYFVRRDSFKGTYSASQLTMFVSLLF